MILCVTAALVTFFFIRSDITRRRGMIWSDALGLAAFGVVGCHVALEFGAPFVIAVFMGMVTATGGGLIPALRHFGVPEIPAELAACLAAFLLRASAIIFDIRMGPPGEFIRIGRTGEDQRKH